MDWITDPQGWIALATLAALEVVLGIDNIIFISILSGKLPVAQRQRARNIGLMAAMLGRIALLFSLVWIMRLTTPLFSFLEHGVSGRDLILIAGGLFLMAKSTHEIHEKLEGEADAAAAGRAPSFSGVIAQILVLDIVFSLDSVITAVGMVRQISIMITAVIFSVGFMMFFSGAIGDFVHRHPTLKMLALSFLLLIGLTLVAEGLGQHIPKGYVYFAMAFSVFVEALNLRSKRRTPPIQLREPYHEDAPKA